MKAKDIFPVPYDADDITATTRRVTYRMDRPLSAADRDALDAAMKRTIPSMSFEAQVRAIEPDLQREAEQTPAAYGSRSYYARELLDQIAYVRFVRDEIKSRGGIDAALAAAARVGFLLAECWAKHDWPVVDIGVRFRREQREKGRRGGLRKGESSKGRDTEIKRLATRYWSSYNLQDQFPSVTGYVFHGLSNPKPTEKTLRKRLKELGLDKQSR